MADLIVQDKIPGVAVYGVEQYSYTVDGASGKDYAAALAAASFKEAVAVEQALTAYTAVVRQRERKLEDLGEVLAILNKAYATMRTKNQERGDKSDADDRLVSAKNTAATYGVTISLTDGNKITRGNTMTAQNNVQYAMDREDNELKQDMVSLNSYITKRDNSYSTAAKFVKKYAGSADAVIRNFS